MKISNYFLFTITFLFFSVKVISQGDYKGSPANKNEPGVTNTLPVKTNSSEAKDSNSQNSSTDNSTISKKDEKTRKKDKKSKNQEETGQSETSTNEKLSDSAGENRNSKSESNTQASPPVYIKPSFVDPSSNLKYLNNPEIENAISTARNYLIEHKFNECIKVWDRIIVSYPGYSIAFYNRAIAKLMSGDKPGAKPDFQKAFDLGLLDNEEIMKRYY